MKSGQMLKKEFVFLIDESCSVLVGINGVNFLARGCPSPLCCHRSPCNLRALVAQQLETFHTVHYMDVYVCVGLLIILHFFHGSDVILMIIYNCLQLLISPIQFLSRQKW
jgi:hypothetical protein